VRTGSSRARRCRWDHVRRAARALLYAGTAAAVFGLAKAHAVTNEYDWSESGRVAWSLAYIGLLCLTAFGFGFPELLQQRWRAYVGALGAVGSSALGISVAQLVMGAALLPRFVVFGAGALCVPWFVVCAKVAAGGTGRSEQRDRILVVARRADATLLAEELAGAPERVASVVGLLEPTEAGADGARPLAEVAAASGATVVVLCRDARVDESIVAQAAALHAGGVRIRTLSLFYEEWLGKLPVSELERVSLLFDIGELHHSPYVRAKRMGDLALALCGAVVLAVAVPLVLVGNLIANRGPLLYRQVRVGKGGKRFEMLKFRTMVPADDGGLSCEWTAVDDDRITGFGRLLRRSHLDELPQVLNIMRGDLAVVGPRPEQPHYVEELTEKLPFYDLRHLVRPGLTGWAQVKYGYAGSEGAALEKLQYEFYYLRNQSIRLDLRIVGRTVRSVLGSQGRGR